MQIPYGILKVIYKKKRLIKILEDNGIVFFRHGSEHDGRRFFP
jgi:hypothetical protein